APTAATRTATAPEIAAVAMRVTSDDMVLTSLARCVIRSSVRRWHPGVTALVVDGLRRRRESGVGERTHGNANRIRSPLRFPKYGRAAIGAKVKVHREPTVGIPSIGPKDSARCNVLAGKKCRNAVWAAGPLLAIEAVAQRDFHRLAGTRD